MLVELWQPQMSEQAFYQTGTQRGLTVSSVADVWLHMPTRTASDQDSWLNG